MRDTQRAALTALRVSAIAAALWLLSPVLSAAHLEAFTATLSSMAISANEHALASDDPSYPIVVEFLYQSRIGTVGLLRLLVAIVPTAGDWAFRSLMIASLATILAASAVLARRWGSAAWAGIAAVILTPGIVEAAFGFNDNIVSAALMMAGLSLIAPGGSVSLACAGALMSLATLARIDGILALPSAAGFIWLASERPQTLVRHSVLFGAGYLLGLGALFALWHVDLLAVWRIVEYFKSVHEIVIRTLGHLFWVSVLFFGLPMLMLLPLGIWDGLRSAQWKYRLVLVIYPIVLAVLCVPRAPQTRDYLLLLTPYIAVTGGRAIEVLVQLLKQSTPALRAIAVVASVVIGLILVFPPPTVMLQDGPRTPIGRLWSPLVWFRWQRGVESNLARVEQVVTVADSTARTGVISTSFDDDRFLHLRLLQRGYRLGAPRPFEPQCERAIEIYRRGSHEVFLLRTHNYYLLAPAPSDYVQALLLDTGARCSQLLHADRFFLTTVGTFEDFSAGTETRATQLFDFILERPSYARLPAHLDFDTGFTVRSPFWHKQLLIRVAELSAQDLNRLTANAQAVLAHFRTDGTPTNELLSYESFRTVFDRKYWVPPDSAPLSSP